MEYFSTAYLFLHGVTDTCSFLDVFFFTAKVFLGDITNYCQLSRLTVVSRAASKAETHAADNK